MRMRMRMRLRGLYSLFFIVTQHNIWHNRALAQR